MQRGQLLFIILLHAISLTSAQVMLQQPGTGQPRWFPFTSGKSTDPGVIGMQSWLDAPAGRHGFVQMNDNELRFEDGRKVKFWGTNICSQLPFIDKLRADSF